MAANRSGEAPQEAPTGRVPPSAGRPPPQADGVMPGCTGGCSPPWERFTSTGPRQQRCLAVLLPDRLRAGGVHDRHRSQPVPRPKPCPGWAGALIRRPPAWWMGSWLTLTCGHGRCGQVKKPPRRVTTRSDRGPFSKSRPGRSSCGRTRPGRALTSGLDEWSSARMHIRAHAGKVREAESPRSSSSRRRGPDEGGVLSWRGRSTAPLCGAGGYAGKISAALGGCRRVRGQD